MAIASLSAIALLGMFIGGCSSAAPPATAPSAFAELDPQISDPPVTAIRLKLFLDNTDPSASDIARLTLVVSNISDKPISFREYEGEVPMNLYIRTNDPKISDVCIWNGEPPHSTVTIAPGGSRFFHPLDPSIGFVLATYPKGGPCRAAHDVSLRVHAEWVSESQRAITSNDVIFQVK